jgi:PPOX class probable F420-dependent enzyme
MAETTSPIESITASAQSPGLGDIAGKANDPVLWLGTVSPKGRPSIRPVWFVLHEGVFVIFSPPAAWKVRHLQANPDVVIHFHTDPAAKNLLVVAGRAEVTDGLPPSSIPAYWLKYQAAMASYEYTPERFDALYPIRITITPERAWGW